MKEITDADRAFAKHCAEKVAKIFQAMGWTWGMHEHAHLPDEDEIRKELLDLIQIGNCGNGRLFVKDDGGPFGTNLEVSVEIGLMDKDGEIL